MGPARVEPGSRAGSVERDASRGPGASLERRAMEESYKRPPTLDTVVARPRASRIHTRDHDFLLTDLIARESSRLDPSSIPITDAFKASSEGKRLKRLFDMVDVDGSGAIDQDELLEVMKLLGKEPTRRELISLISAVDTSGSGEIDEEEFMKMMQDPILSTDDKAAASMGCLALCLPAKKGAPTMSFTGVMLAAEKAGVDPLAARTRGRGGSRAHSDDHETGETLRPPMPPPVSPSTEPPRRTKFGMMANGPIVEEKDAGEEEESGDPYFKIVRIGEAAEADTTDYTTLSLKALQIKCQELDLEWRDAGSKKLILAERIDQDRTEKRHAKQDAQVNRLISDANEISDEPYGKLKQRDLKERCTRYGLPTNGGKKALVARLEAHRTDKKSEANNARFQMKQDLAARKLTAKFREPDPMAIAAAAGNAPGKKEKKAMEAKEQAKVATGGKADGGEEGAA